MRRLGVVWLAILTVGFAGQATALSDAQKEASSSDITATAGALIDDDIPLGTLGHWDVDVTTGGESRDANLTAMRLASNDISTEDVLFDYFSYVDPGNNGGGFRLSGSAPVVDVNDPDKVSSSGSFTGANGNMINWTVTSSIPNNVPTMTNVFTFTAATGTLGVLRFLQYLDEDIESVSDDVFYIRGSAAANDLQLFTVDNTQVYGVSHSGALSASTGLVNAAFAGWAADQYNNMKPRIEGAGQGIALTGVIANLASFTHPQVGPAFGPADIVSVLAWDLDPAATTATIITTLGGVPQAASSPQPAPVLAWPLLVLLAAVLFGVSVVRLARNSQARP